jgi:outer membrane protein assembly factor BamA
MRALEKCRDAVLIAAVVGVLLVLKPATTEVPGEATHRAETPAVTSARGNEIALCVAQMSAAKPEPESTDSGGDPALDMANELVPSARLALAAARFQEERGNDDEAHESYKQILRNNPRSVEAIIGLGRTDQKAGRIAKAERAFREAVSLELRPDLALDALGQWFVEQKRWDEAVSTLGRAWDAAPNDKTIEFHYAIALAKSGDVGRAFPLLLETVGTAAAHYNVGLVLHEGGELAASEAEFAKAVAENPELEQARYWLKEVHRELARQLANAGAGQSHDDELPSAPLSAIVIEGNDRRKTEEILKLIKTQVGQPVDAKLVKEDISALLKVRWFLNVEARVARSPAGPVLVVTVVERPLLEKITLTGNDKFGDAALLDVTGLTPNYGYDVRANKESARRIEKLYRDAGHVHVKVTLERGRSPDDREVIFKIDEGPKVVVSKIGFEGNDSVPEWILRLQLKNTTPTWLISDGLYDPSTVPQDIIALKQYYQDLGFFDIEVTHRELASADQSRVYLRFVITEGIRFRVRSIEFVGNRAIPAESLRDGLSLRENEYYDQSLVNADQHKILNQYQAHGRIFASVEPKIKSFEEPGPVDIVYVINEDEPLHSLKPYFRGDDLPLRHQASDETEPPGLRDPENIHFRGIEAFDLGEVRKQLSQDFDLLSRDQADDDFIQYLDSLEAALRSGYRHGGFPEAEVEVVYNNSRERIEAWVAEGKRYRCGDVKISGAKQVSAEIVAAWLTEDPKLYRVLWKKEAPVPFDDDNFRTRDRLKSEYGYAGLFYPDFDVGINSDDDTGIATLVITVHDEGPRAVIGKVKVTGTKRDSAEEVLQYLDLRPGAPFDSGLCHRMERRLLESGRYLAADVEIEYLYPSENGAVEGQPLAIRLHEYKDAPPLGADYSPAEHALLKLRDWLGRWAEGDIEEDVVATFDLAPHAVAKTLSGLGELLPEGWQLDKVRDMQATLRMVLGPNHGQTIALRVLGASGEPFLDIVFVAGPDRLVLADLARKAKLVLPRSTKPRLVFSVEGRSPSKHDSDSGESRFSFMVGMGLSNKSRPCPSPFEVQSKFSSACMISFAHGEKSRSMFADGVLSIQDETSHIEIDAASGRLVEWRSQDDEDGWKLTVRAEKDALKHELERLRAPLAASAVAYDGDSPWKSLLEFIVDEWQYGASQASSGDLTASLAALHKLVHHWSPPGFEEVWGSDEDAREPHESFQVPSQLQGFNFDAVLTPRSRSRKNLVGMILPKYRRLVPETSWLWSAGRDAAVYWAASDDHEGFRLHKLFLACLDWQLGQIIDRHAQHPGMEPPSAGAFAELWRPFLNDESWMGKWCLSLAQSAARLDEKEVEALVRFLPEPELQKTVADCVRVLRSDADQPIAELVQTALGRLWFDLVQPYVEANFGGPGDPSDHWPLKPIPENQVLPAAAEEEADEDECDSLPEIRGDDAGEPARFTPRQRGDSKPRPVAAPPAKAVPINEIPEIPEPIP